MNSVLEVSFVSLLRSLFLPLQFKIEPFKHPLKLDPDYAGTSRPSSVF
jgi:hypothetical protein